MPKNIEERKDAIPIQDFIKNLQIVTSKAADETPKLTSSLVDGTIALILKKILETVNLDVCVSDSQQDLLGKLIFIKAKERVNKDIEIDEVVASLLPIINTIKLECKHCLNENCNMRGK